MVSKNKDHGLCVDLCMFVMKVYVSQSAVHWCCLVFAQLNLSYKQVCHVLHVISVYKNPALLSFSNHTSSHCKLQ